MDPILLTHRGINNILSTSLTFFTHWSTDWVHLILVPNTQTEMLNGFQIHFEGVRFEFYWGPDSIGIVDYTKYLDMLFHWSEWEWVSELLYLKLTTEEDETWRKMLSLTGGK